MSEMNTANQERWFTVAEVEQIVSKRFAKLNERNEARIRQAYAEGLEEAQRNAQSTPEERNFALERRERILQEREQLLRERELRARVVEELKNREIPSELAVLVPCTDEKSFSQGLEVIDKCFRKMLRNEIDQRLAASSVPPTRSGRCPSENKAVGMVGRINMQHTKDAEISRQVVEKYM